MKRMRAFPETGCKSELSESIAWRRENMIEWINEANELYSMNWE